MAYVIVSIGYVAYSIDSNADGAETPGLSIRVRLLRSLPQRFKVDIRVKPGSHQSEHARTSHHLFFPAVYVLHGCTWNSVTLTSQSRPPVNKQLNDKERVAAALENPALVEVLEQCLSTAGRSASEEA